MTSVVHQSIVISMDPIRFGVRTETDDSGTWWRGSLVLTFERPTPHLDGGVPGTELDTRTVWVSPWRQVNPSVPDYAAGQRMAVNEVVNRLTERLIVTLRDGEML